MRSKIRTRLEQAIADLPSQFRLVFLLGEIECLSVEETDDSPGMVPAPAKTRRLRAKRRLQEALAPELKAVLSGAFCSLAPIASLEFVNRTVFFSGREASGHSASGLVRIPPAQQRRSGRGDQHAAAGSGGSGAAPDRICDSPDLAAHAGDNQLDFIARGRSAFSQASEQDRIGMAPAPRLHAPVGL